MSVSRPVAAVRSLDALAPRVIRNETPHFLLRTLEPDDVTDRACAWFADPSKASMINLPARAFSRREFADYIASHDRINGHILGIFEKPSGQFIGFWAVYIDWERREYLINVLVGERGNPNSPREETERAITSIFFEDFDLLVLRFSVLARNVRMEGRMDLAGISSDHTTFNPSASTEAFEEVHHYSLTREAWHKFRDSRALRDLIRALTEAARAGI